MTRCPICGDSVPDLAEHARRSALRNPAEPLRYQITRGPDAGQWVPIEPEKVVGS